MGWAGQYTLSTQHTLHPHLSPFQQLSLPRHTRSSPHPRPVGSSLLLGALSPPRTLVRSATIATQHALYPASRPAADSLTQRTLSTKNSRPVSNYRYSTRSLPRLSASCRLPHSAHSLHQELPSGQQLSLLSTLSTPPLGQLATPSLSALSQPRTLVRSATIATEHTLPPQPPAQSAAHFTQRNLSERVARSFHPALPFYPPRFPRCSRSHWALRPPIYTCL
jgi:hypothetical protein